MPGTSESRRATLTRLCFFFFQAEDGIRDYKVTGVQTCALPILLAPLAQVAPRLGCALYTEERIAALWPQPGPPLLDRAARLDCMITLGGDGTLDRKSVV